MCRVLVPSGMVALSVNSIENPEYGTGELLEPDYYLIHAGRPKRYFSPKSLGELTTKFKIILLENSQGEVARNKSSDVRFIGQKV